MGNLSLTCPEPGLYCDTYEAAVQERSASGTPEQRARERIDELLEAAGWVVQDQLEMNLGAGIGVAVREFALDTGVADYLLFINREACGVIEARSEGATLSGVSDQTALYQAGVPKRNR